MLVEVSLGFVVVGMDMEREDVRGVGERVVGVRGGL
jgi:hypothetical protein